MDMALLKSLIGVIITLVVLGLFAFYLKKINHTHLKNKFIRIKEILNITPKTKLAIIEVGDESLLFSISDTEVRLIQKLPSFEKVLKQNEQV